MYYRQVIEPIGGQAVVVGAVMLAFAIFVVVASVFVVYTERADERDQAWTSTLAAKWNDPSVDGGRAEHAKAEHAAQERLERAIVDDDDDVHAPSSTRREQQQQHRAPPTASSSSQNPRFRPVDVDATLVARIRAFYRQHDDPDKLESDVVSIAMWALQNGVPALNKKLREKYGCDLDSDEPPI